MTFFTAQSVLLHHEFHHRIRSQRLQQVVVRRIGGNVPPPKALPNPNHRPRADGNLPGSPFWQLPGSDGAQPVGDLEASDRSRQLELQASIRLLGVQAVQLFAVGDVLTEHPGRGARILFDPSKESRPRHLLQIRKRKLTPRASRADEHTDRSSQLAPPGSNHTHMITPCPSLSGYLTMSRPRGINS